MKSKFIWHAGEWVDVTDWRPPPRKTPYIIRDSMDAAVHPATGQTLDSKSRFREITKAHGLVEVGTDTMRTNHNPAAELAASRKKDIAEAFQMVEQGYTPPPVESVSDWGETRVYGDA